MRGLCRRAAGPPHDIEGRGGDEQRRVRCERYDEEAAGFRQGEAVAVQISARSHLHRGIAEDRHRQDRPSGGDADLGAVIASEAKQSRLSSKMDCFVALLLAMTSTTI